MPPPPTTKPAHHRQKQKLLLRKSCRKIKELFASLSAKHDFSSELLLENETALKTLLEACSGDERNENEKDVEVMLGTSLLSFLRDLESSLKGALGKSGQGQEPALQNMLTLASAWHRALQNDVDEARQARKEWESKYPILASQEYELSLYTEPLLALLSADAADSVTTAQWKDAEKSLGSLQVYLLEHKVSAEQVKSGGDKGIEQVLRGVLKQFEDWDSEGFGVSREGKKGDLEVAERIWGRADKVGSGLNYLLTLHERGDTVEGVKPTTRSVFLLKSAPPAKFRFSASKNEWFESQLKKHRDTLYSIVLDPSNRDITREDEARWKAAYQELDALERFLKGPGKKVSLKSIKASRIDETISLMCARLESLHMQLRGGEDDESFALMYISWELAMRIGHTFAVMHEEEQ